MSFGFEIPKNLCHTQTSLLHAGHTTRTFESSGIRYVSLKFSRYFWVLKQCYKTIESLKQTYGKIFTVIPSSLHQRVNSWGEEKKRLARKRNQRTTRLSSAPRPSLLFFCHIHLPYRLIACSITSGACSYSNDSPHSRSHEREVVCFFLCISG